MLQTDMGTMPVMLLSVGLLFLGFILGWLVSTKLAHSKVVIIDRSTVPA